MKRTGCLSGLLRYQELHVPRSCFVGVAQNVFTPKRYQFKNNALSPVIVIVLSSYPKKNTKAATVDFFRLNTLKGKKTVFLTLKGTTSTPALFIF